MNKKKILITTIAIALLLLLTAITKISITIKSIKCADRVEVPAPQPKKANEVEVPSRYVGDFSISHYCPCHKCVGSKKVARTSTGTTPRANHTIAADPRVIPLHSVVYIEGLGVYEVEDTGSAIKGYVLDVFVQDHQTAVNLGTLGGKKFKVYIIG